MLFAMVATFESTYERALISAEASAITKINGESVDPFNRYSYRVAIKEAAKDTIENFKLIPPAKKTYGGKRILIIFFIVYFPLAIVGGLSTPKYSQYGEASVLYGWTFVLGILWCFGIIFWGIASVFTRPKRQAALNARREREVHLLADKMLIALAPRLEQEVEVRKARELEEDRLRQLRALEENRLRQACEAEEQRLRQERLKRGEHPEGKIMPAPDPQIYGVSSAGYEELCAMWMRHLGEFDAFATAPTADGGIDVESSRWIAQCKLYTNGVSIESVRALAGIALLDNKRAVFFTSGTYSPGIVSFADRARIALFEYQPITPTLLPKNFFAEYILENTFNPDVWPE